jgi:uncharacterized protein (TIGR02284 family)
MYRVLHPTDASNKGFKMTTVTTECAEKLNGILKGERSAVETYRQALEKTTDVKIRPILESNHSCHQARVQTLSTMISQAGGKPAETSGAWGAFAKMMEGGAKVFGDAASIAVLEEGEDKGLADYKGLLNDSNIEVKNVATQMISKQEGTHAKMRDLKKSL